MQPYHSSRMHLKKREDSFSLGLSDYDDAMLSFKFTFTYRSFRSMIT